MSEVEEAHRSVQQSRSERYLNNWDESTRELIMAADALRRLEASLKHELPAAERRTELIAELNAFKMELRLAQRIHDHAASWENGWANAVQEALGLRAASYGPDGTALRGESIRRTAWEG